MDEEVEGSNLGEGKKKLLLIINYEFYEFSNLSKGTNELSKLSSQSRVPSNLSKPGPIELTQSRVPSIQCKKSRGDGKPREEGDGKPRNKEMESQDLIVCF